jgi:predicted RNase H-related nuclease YkuK (DUF458 family)
MNFRDYSNNKLTIQDIINITSDNPSEYRVYIGTDSQIKRKEKKVLYATCIVLYRKQKGGRIFISRYKTKIPSSLKERLAAEVWRSLETALLINQLDNKLDLVIHIDVNKSTKHKSGEYQNELANIVVAQGFKVEVKPDSWSSSHVADRYAKREDI